MNQILATEPSKNDKRSNSNGPIDIRKIIGFFACAIILFGLILAGTNAYKMYKRNKEQLIQTEPIVEMEQLENSVRIKAEYDKGIYKLGYYWNSGDKTEEVQDGKTGIEKLIEVPKGVDTLTVEITDSNAKTNTYSKTFDELTANNTTIIDISPTNDGSKIKIVVQNIHGLKYIKYKVNDNEDIQIDSDPTNPNTIEVTIDINNLEIGRGQNKISVVAVDMQDNENTAEKTIEGQNEPVINVLRNGDVVECEITHDMGFEKIEFNINGEIIVYDENSPVYNQGITTFKCPIKLKEGENILIITAYSLEGTTKTYAGKTTL